MLTITRNQIEIFQNSSFKDFLTRMTEFIIENFGLTDSTGKLTEEIRLVIREAEYYGFETEDTVEQYLFLKWKYPAFQTKPFSKEIHEIISYPDREPEKIIDELIIFLSKSV